MDERADLERRVVELEQEVARLKGRGFRSVRKRAELEIMGLPAYDVALGPDFSKGEMRGHAKGFIAIGDIASGVIAIGGLARGVVAIGGLALGLLSLGGLSIGLLLAVGGGAIGGVAAGGGAGGGVAFGGGAMGYYVCAGGGAGKYVMSAERQDPQAREFFERYHVPCNIPMQRPRGGLRR
jgi:hypothetical protein